MSILIAILNVAFDIVKRLVELKSILQAVSVKADQILDLLTLGIADHIVFSVTLEGHTTTGVTTTMLTDSQQETLSITVLDKKGKPASLDGVPVWATSDATVATVDASADPTGLNAVLTAVSPGTVDVTVSGDADLGTGVTPIVGKLTVTVTAGQATQITISEGTPTDQ